MHDLFWALLILFLAGVFFQMDWIYYLVYVLGGVWIFSHWWIRRALRQLEVFRVMTDHAFLGERPIVKLRFVNRSWLPLAWLQIQEQIPLDLKDVSEYNKIVTVAGRSTLEHTYQLYCKRRGYYSVGPLQLRTGDLFGFVNGGRQENNAVAMTVYPQVLPLEKLGLPSRSPFGTLASRQRLFEDPARVAGVRSYSSGDSQRTIHWKASARENTLLVKKFQPAIALNVAIVLDLNRDTYPYRGEIGFSEWAIVVAASLASHLTGQRQAVGLMSNGLDSVSAQPLLALPARTGQGHLMNILSTLARAEMDRSNTQLADWLPKQLVGMEWGATIILVTPKVTDTTLWALHHAYRRGSNVIALVCAPQPDFDQMQSQSKKLGVQLHKTVWERDLAALQG